MPNLNIVACDGVKNCKSCKKEFPITDFRLYGKGKKYRYPYCPACTLLQTRLSKDRTRNKQLKSYIVESLPGEMWRPVRDYEGLYEVSNLGRVKRLFVTVGHKSAGKLTTRERLLSQSLSQHGYRKVSLSKYDITRVVNVHLLVWESWGDSERDGLKWVVDHKNNNREDNSIDNLQCITQRLNATKDRVKKHSSLPGVFKHSDKRKKWESRIIINGHRKRLGLFYTEQEAHDAYNKALQSITS